MLEILDVLEEIERLINPIWSELEKALFVYQKLCEYLGINNIDLLETFHPNGAFYVMVDISKIFGKEYNGKVIKGSMDFSKAILDKEKVAVIPGIAFGNDNYIRLSYATSMENIEEGIRRIEKFIKSL